MGNYKLGRAYFTPEPEANGSLRLDGLPDSPREELEQRFWQLTKTRELCHAVTDFRMFGGPSVKRELYVRIKEKIQATYGHGLASV